jgi:hypothetical protein
MSEYLISEQEAYTAPAPVTAEQLVAAREERIRAASTAYRQVSNQLLDATACIRPRFRTGNEIIAGQGCVVRGANSAEEAALLEAEDFQTTLPRNLFEADRYVEVFGVYPTGTSGL